VRILRVAHSSYMPEETETSLLDERQQLRRRAGSESYISIRNIICVRNPKNRSEADVVKSSDFVFQSSCQSPSFRTIEKDRLNVNSI